MFYLPSLAQLYLVLAQGRNLTNSTQNSGRYNHGAGSDHSGNIDQLSHLTDEKKWLKEVKSGHAAHCGTEAVDRVDSGYWLAHLWGLPQRLCSFVHTVDYILHDNIS